MRSGIIKGKWKWKKVKSLSHVWLFATPWTVAYQAPPSMGFSRQEYWSGLPLPSPGDLPDPRIKPRSPTFQADALTSEPPGKPEILLLIKGAREQTRWALRPLWTLGCIIQAERDGPVELSRHIFYVPMCYTVTCNISETRCCENKYLNKLEVGWEKLSRKQAESLISHIKPLDCARREHRPLKLRYTYSMW